MKPVLASQPQKMRTLLFAPTLLGLLLVLFLVIGFATDVFLVSLVVSGVLATAGSVVLWGWPQVTRKDGSPIVPPRWKPYLFFLIAPLLGVTLYFLLGALLTGMRLPATILAYVSLGVSIVGACALAYWLVGFPHVVQGAKNAYATVPQERRPFLFFPLFVLFFLVIFVGLGVGTTMALGKLKGSGILLNIQVLVLLPLSLLMAAGGAYLLVGIPRPQQSPTKYLPKVTGKHRPLVFAGTFLVLGIPLVVAIGALLTFVTGKTSAFPKDLVLPLSILLGYMLSLGIAALWWGTPARWRQYEDYTPGIPPRARLPLYVGAGLGVLVTVTIVFGLAGADIFWGLLTGALLGIVVSLQLAGLIGVIAKRREADTLLPDLPDRMKPLVFFPAWLLLAALLFVVLTYALPDLIQWNVLVSLVTSLALVLFLVEEALWKELVADRREQKARRKAWEQRRAEALRAAEESSEG